MINKQVQIRHLVAFLGFVQDAFKLKNTARFKFPPLVQNDNNERGFHPRPKVLVMFFTHSPSPSEDKHASDNAQGNAALATNDTASERVLSSPTMTIANPSSVNPILSDNPADSESSFSKGPWNAESVGVNDEVSTSGGGFKAAQGSPSPEQPDSPKQVMQATNAIDQPITASSPRTRVRDSVFSTKDAGIATSANLAPTNANVQPVSIIVTHEQTRSQIAEEVLTNGEKHEISKEGGMLRLSFLDVDTGS